MQANLSAALAHIFVSEGGFAERANEPGGSVNMGISQQTLATWRQKHGQPVPTVDDVRALTRDEASRIYEALYAVPIRFDDLPAGLDYCVLDAAVNEGVGGARRFLADAVGMLPHDLPAGVPEGVDVPVTINRICDARLAVKKQRAEWVRFGRGWTNRIEGVRKVSIELAGRSDRLIAS